MTLRSLLNNLGFVFKPFAQISDMALHAVGYRENAEETGQPIPVNLAVKSALILPPIYIVASFLLAVVLDNAGVQANTIQFRPAWIWMTIWAAWFSWCAFGFLLAPLQVRRVLRLNRQARRHRLGNLERMAKRETAIEENTLSLARYEVQELPVQIVTGS